MDIERLSNTAKQALNEIPQSETSQLRVMIGWVSDQYEELLRSPERKPDDASVQVKYQLFEEMRQRAADRLAQLLEPPQGIRHRLMAWLRPREQPTLEDARAICRYAETVPDAIVRALLVSESPDDWLLLVTRVVSITSQDAAAEKLLCSNVKLDPDELIALLTIESVRDRVFDRILTLPYDAALYARVLRTYKITGAQENHVGEVILDHDPQRHEILLVMRTCRGTAQNRAISTLMDLHPTPEELAMMMECISPDHPRYSDVFSRFRDSNPAAILREALSFALQERCQARGGRLSELRPALIETLDTPCAGEARDLLLASEPSGDELYVIYRKLPDGCSDKTAVGERLCRVAERGNDRDAFRGPDGFLLHKIVLNCPPFAERAARFMIEHWHRISEQDRRDDFLHDIAERVPVLRERAETLMEGSGATLIDRMKVDRDLGGN